MTENDADENEQDEEGVSWLMIGIIIVIFLAFTVIPAIIFFSDRAPPVLSR